MVYAILQGQLHYVAAEVYRFSRTAVAAAVTSYGAALSAITYCEGVTYWAIGVKHRSITQPRGILITTLSLPLNGGNFEASEPCTSVR